MYQIYLYIFIYIYTYLYIFIYIYHSHHYRQIAGKCLALHIQVWVRIWHPNLTVPISLCLSFGKDDSMKSKCVRIPLKAIHRERSRDCRSRVSISHQKVSEGLAKPRSGFEIKNIARKGFLELKHQLSLVPWMQHTALKDHGSPCVPSPHCGNDPRFDHSFEGLKHKISIVPFVYCSHTFFLRQPDQDLGKSAGQRRMLLLGPV